MPFWDRYIRPKIGFGEQPSMLIDSAALMLARINSRSEEDPRTLPAMGALLGLLWQDDAASVSAVESTFLTLGPRFRPAFLQTLRQRLRAASGPTAGSYGPEKRYAIVASALLSILQENRPDPTTQSGALISATLAEILVDSLRLSQYIQAVEVEAEAAHQLSGLKRLLKPLDQIDRKGARIGDSLGSGATSGYLSAEEQEYAAASRLRAETIKIALEQCLASFPPDRIPTFWNYAASPTSALEMRGVIERITDRRALPYLVSLLMPVTAGSPRTSESGLFREPQTDLRGTETPSGRPEASVPNTRASGPAARVPGIPVSCLLAVVETLRNLDDPEALPALEAAADSLDQAAVVSEAARRAAVHIVRMIREQKQLQASNISRAEEKLKRPVYLFERSQSLSRTKQGPKEDLDSVADEDLSVDTSEPTDRSRNIE